MEQVDVKCRNTGKQTAMKFLQFALVSMLSITNAAMASLKVNSKIAGEAVVAANAFTTDLYAQLRDKPGNICISPLSVSTALGMVSAGANGKTASQMLGVLHWTGDRSKLPPANAAMSAQLMDPTSLADTTQMFVANALFGQKGYPYRPDFANLMNQKYGAELRTVDFANDAAESIKQINEWGAKHTANKIPDALSPNSLTPATRLVVVNAVYFRDKWQTPFSTQATMDQPFYQAAEQLKVSMMRRTSETGFMQDDKIQAVELPYRGDFSMVVLLPLKSDSFDAMEKSVTAAAINNWTAALVTQTVDVSLPRFAMKCSYVLNKPLISLGMSDAFDPDRADFSGISSQERLEFDKVSHKTFVQVDEQGTEAAAVTSVTMAPAAAHRVEQVAVFKADHPFLFLIRQRSTGAVLFIGRVAKPE